MVKLTDDQVRFVCRLGKGHKTCSYLCLKEEGFVCGKSDPKIKLTIDSRRDAGKMAARGNHCLGPPSFQRTDS
jgi:hypothetical protein